MDVFAIIVSLIVLSFLTYTFLCAGKRYGNLPPGPMPLPLVGNLLQLVGKDLREVFRQYRKTYGDVFTLRVFDQTLIIVNGFEAIKDISVKNGDIFSERPKMDTLMVAIKGEGIAFSSGEIWKHNRRFLIRTLRDFGMGKSKLQIAIHEEISHFRDALQNEQERPFDIQYLITVAVSNIMCSLVFGNRFDYADEEFIGMVRRSSDIFAANLSVKPYWLRFIPGDPFRVNQCVVNLKHLDKFYRAKVREHYKDFDAKDMRDVIDAYIKQMKIDEATDGTSRVNEDEIVRTVHELFVAGGETTPTALRFALLFMLRHPEIQEKLASEVRNYVPDNRLPDNDDIKKMPYLQATTSEILRRASIGPFSAPHATKTDRQYRGYSIPRSASILLNLESVLLDESVWAKPMDFNPSRFMNENALQSKPEELIPFGIGPRVCPGESMARMELTLFLSAMLQRFKFLPPEDEDPPSLDTRLGTTAVPVPFKLRAMRRV